MLHISYLLISEYYSMIQIYRGLFNHLSIRQFPCFQFFQLQIELPCTFLCKFLCGLSFLFLQVRTRSMIAISYKRSYLAYTHLVYNAGDPGLIPESGRSSGEGNGNPLLPGKSHGRRSLVGYSLWGCKESDTTERLHFTSDFFS